MELSQRYLTLGKTSVRLQKVQIMLEAIPSGTFAFATRKLDAHEACRRSLTRTARVKTLQAITEIESDISDNGVEADADAKFTDAATTIAGEKETRTADSPIPKPIFGL